MEQKSLSDLNKLQAGERLVPSRREVSLMYPMVDHLARYHFAEKYVKDQAILDVGCGTGYGSATVAHNSRFLVGIDQSRNAISYAGKHYAGPRTEFIVQDASHLGFSDDTFDVVLSFEMIEHLQDPAMFLSQINRVLRKGGLFIISTPNKIYTSPGRATPIWKFHKTEYYASEFEDLLRQFFEVRMFGQRISSTQYAQWDKRILKLQRYGRILPSALIRLVPMRFIFATVGGAPQPKMDEISISTSDVATSRTLIGVCTKRGLRP